MKAPSQSPCDHGDEGCPKACDEKDEGQELQPLEVLEEMP